MTMKPENIQKKPPCRTVQLSSYEAYLEYLEDSPGEDQDRKGRVARFPFTVILLVAVPEMDFANRWCWLNFGPADGQCMQFQSEYPACTLAQMHSHTGKWCEYWLEKIDYDFGFCEWYFAEESHRDNFLAFVPEINWGEKFPK